MPKEITHWMLAERALEALPEGSRLRKVIACHKKAYLGGAVLPDTLAHIFKGPFHPTARELGHRFHDAPGNSYAPLIAVERRFPDGLPPELLSCLLGVISHMEADVSLHPYVYAASGQAGIGEHYRIETAIDLHFLRSPTPPGQRRLDRLLCPATRKVMASAAGHLFDPEGALPPAALERALELHCRFQAMYDRTLWKIAVRLLARIFGSPYREQRHLFYPLRGRWGGGKFPTAKTKWRHPESGEMRDSGIEELTRETVERTVRVFERIEQAGSLATALSTPPGANLLTGLPGVTKDGKG
ncbi:zinc dependent phospholipase C family protein [Geomonas sp.]|uniref:zinc dependent phospholipase C family protein n=1 Tax=Geomonas sp. TaxID=2651584 RepID=UPI002B47A17E|nr:zinc dependent phospholipase C family protein [Geomonas sp.]HJV36294.1 zinc dependent phospholipase C family protein [Geomonas sp.]